MKDEVQKSTLDDLGGFSAPAILILVSLAGGPKHGYAMIEDIRGVTGVKLGAGTLYGAIARLESRGLIEAMEPEQRRNPFRLTEPGKGMLRERLRNLAVLARVGEQRLAES